MNGFDRVREAMLWSIRHRRINLFYSWGCGILGEGLGDLWKPTWLRELAPNMRVLQLLSQVTTPESQSANKINSNIIEYKETQ